MMGEVNFVWILEKVTVFQSEGRITRKIVYEIFVISKSQDFFEIFGIFERLLGIFWRIFKGFLEIFKGFLKSFWNF